MRWFFALAGTNKILKCTTIKPSIRSCYMRQKALKYWSNYLNAVLCNVKHGPLGQVNHFAPPLFVKQTIQKVTLIYLEWLSYRETRP